MDKQTQDKWNNIRSNRNGLLAQTDWCVLPDAPFTSEQIEEIKIYRQKLRDISKDYENPDDVVFPKLPDFLN
jgi:hypothetical protein